MYNDTMVTVGASLVQWNRLNGNIIASAHDSDIRIWDMRVGLGGGGGGDKSGMWGLVGAGGGRGGRGDSGFYLE